VLINEEAILHKRILLSKKLLKGRIRVERKTAKVSGIKKGAPK